MKPTHVTTERGEFAPFTLVHRCEEGAYVIEDGGAVLEYPQPIPDSILMPLSGKHTKHLTRTSFYPYSKTYNGVSVDCNRVTFKDAAGLDYIYFGSKRMDTLTECVMEFQIKGYTFRSGSLHIVIQRPKIKKRIYPEVQKDAAEKTEKPSGEEPGFYNIKVIHRKR